MQRCQWHKREAGERGRLSPTGRPELWRGRLQRAYDRTHAEARSALGGLQAQLEDRNQSAAASLAEGLEEALTLPRSGVYGVLGASFKTKNCIESRPCPHRGAPRQDRCLEELEPAPSVACDRAPRHRTETATREGLSALAEASRRIAMRTEDRSDRRQDPTRSMIRGQRGRFEFQLTMA